MDKPRRQLIYRVHHDTGLPLRRLVRETHALPNPEIARRYGCLRKPARSA